MSIPLKPGSVICYIHRAGVGVVKGWDPGGVDGTATNHLRQILQITVNTGEHTAIMYIK